VKRIALTTLVLSLASVGGCGPETPDYQKSEKTVWLDQHWQKEQRDWYHHADQGTQTFGIPYEWLMALEQPTLSFGSAGMFADQAYLDQFGFIPSPELDNATKLPVGFAHGAGIVDPTTGQAWENPQTHQPFTSAGLTCAACHTGRMTYGKTSLFIDGGAAMTDLGKFRTALGLSIAYTIYVPFRADRFAERVLGPNASPEATAALKQKLSDLLKSGKAALALDDGVKDSSLEEGFGRLDALNRIGNQVFALDLAIDENYVGTSAPVHYPHIWDSSWFDWVQYNGSIMQPMVRNAGEAMGVRALVNLTTDNDPKLPLYASTVNMDNLFKMEQDLAGKQPDAATGFTGLRAPAWPADVFGPVDQALAAKGAVLYKELCQGCHLPPVKSPEFWSDKFWTAANAAGERYLKVTMIDTTEIGTDPAQAMGMEYRGLRLPKALGLTTDEHKPGEYSYGPALGAIVQKTVEHWYDSHNIPPEQRQVMNGNRPNELQVPAKYKARPLDGVWASPPYLHNGSVPNIYALLSPAKERPAKFYLGSREYDPVNLGYQDQSLAGGFEFDTSVLGNHNTGHEFDDAPPGGGIIGRKLSPEERRALVEYLKTL
jgi:mono/diheme cytochrome c family protein